MSLYYDAAPFLVPSRDPPKPLKSRIFGSKDLRSSPKQVYALVIEASKWSPFLSDVIDKSQLLRHERKASCALNIPDYADLPKHFFVAFSGPGATTCA